MTTIVGTISRLASQLVDCIEWRPGIWLALLPVMTIELLQANLVQAQTLSDLANSAPGGALREACRASANSQIADMVKEALAYRPAHVEREWERLVLAMVRLAENLA